MSCPDEDKERTFWLVETARVQALLRESWGVGDSAEKVTLSGVSDWGGWRPGGGSRDRCAGIRRP